jgi:hypothetical protein
MTHRRRTLVVGATIAAVIVCVAVVFILDAIAGGIDRRFAVACAVVIGFVIGPLAGLWITAALDDGDIDQAVERRAPTRR